MNLKTLSPSKIAFASALLVAGAAQAQPLLFTLTGGYSASFTLDANPSPDTGVYGIGFTMLDVSGNFPGASTGVVDLTFFDDAAGGAFEIDDYYAGQAVLVSTTGDQLYTGDITAPTFVQGTYTLFDYNGSEATYTLTIADPTATPTPAVPEPATVVSMLAGLGLLGATLRHRKAKDPVIA